HAAKERAGGQAQRHVKGEIDRRLRRSRREEGHREAGTEQAHGLSLPYVVRGVATHLPRGLNVARRREPRSALMMLALSLATVAALGMIIYLASSSLPYLLSSANTDVTFGAMNLCASDLLREPRLGFAVAADASKEAAYSGNKIAVCARPADGGTPLRSEVALAGVAAAAFDFDGTLWAAIGRR